VTEADIARAQWIIRSSGGLDGLETMISAAVAEALASLHSAPLRPEGVERLRELAQIVTVRSA
jgi:geranylgeranyl pyrophosphate synthase